MKRIKPIWGKWFGCKIIDTNFRPTILHRLQWWLERCKWLTSLRIMRGIFYLWSCLSLWWYEFKKIR